MYKGILYPGQGFTRDINSKGIFIYSDLEPPAKGGVEVEVSFPSLGEADANLRMRVQSFMTRSGAASEPRGTARICNEQGKIFSRTPAS
jgi:hypothetical protein